MSTSIGHTFWLSESCLPLLRIYVQTCFAIVSSSSTRRPQAPPLGESCLPLNYTASEACVSHVYHANASSVHMTLHETRTGISTSCIMFVPPDPPPRLYLRSAMMFCMTPGAEEHCRASASQGVVGVSETSMATQQVWGTCPPWGSLIHMNETEPEPKGRRRGRCRCSSGVSSIPGQAYSKPCNGGIW